MMTLLPIGAVRLQVKTVIGYYFILAIDPHYMMWLLFSMHYLKLIVLHYTWNLYLISTAYILGIVILIHWCDYS